jgi:isoquinoline 1-oxidoreductase subunit beta
MKNGAYQQSNFNDYRVLRINETPVVEVYRVESTKSPGGLGEPGTSIAAPALANAIFAATGVRLRSLPVDRKLLVQSPDALKKVVDATASLPGASA